MTTRRQTLEVGSRFGPYRLDRLIGRGGMGEVFEAYDTVKDRTIALKVLPERLHDDPVFRERFRRESHVAARLQEPHIIPIHDYGEIDGRLFIDMRLVGGDSLRALLTARAPLEPERAVAIIRQVAAALDAAHADGLVHRDIKPDNILLTPDGFAYLVDFGIAQSATGESLTSTGSAIGSFHYMAPERFHSRAVTPAADVYALTCVLYECLTGSRPFPKDTEAQIISAHLFEPPPRPHEYRPGLPARLDEVIARGMAKDPQARYATAGELGAAAQTAVASSRSPETPTEPEDKGPPTTGGSPPDRSGATTGPGRRDGGRPRRRQVLRVLALLGVVLLAAALGLLGWESTRPTTGAAVPDASAPHGPDIDLLSLVGPSGYKRANCVHENPAAPTVAVVFCAANPAASDPAARFLRFRTVDQLRGYISSLLTGLQGRNCPGDPPGQDGPMLRDGAEVGRKSCFLSKADDPAAPRPALLVTDEQALAAAVYLWDPADQPYRDYVAARNGFGFRTPETARDPDSFTPADRAVLNHLAGDFGPANCRHAAPPPGPVDAVLACGTKAGFPAAEFFGFPDQESAMYLYEANRGQFSGHVCGSGDPGDDAWRQNGNVLGRFFCYPNTDPALGPSCLFVVHQKFAIAGHFCTLRADHPDRGPKSEADLTAWFRQYFG
ncbi:protein kinase [Nocardia beijingensis]|uniref:serine/threonine-protein kinase n=1 Tax=Nocardia beijingensis TaxID=95162 RepID=UPI00189415AC|nr:serine/threonine-protein kinase [Nocardia beijingensis]MBF6468633.1 protein kinase [Nocardia beijingensis]